ncbi:MAG: Fe-S protein assembly co-chaperone HscB [Burkholderiaceae bacterium]
MNLQANDFELFGLDAQVAQDRTAIDARWKALQREAHPDRFAAQGDAAQRLAMQWSVRINEAYQRLKDPMRRAAYLCELRGAPIDAERNTAMPTAFLMHQLEWREALEEAKVAADAREILAQVHSLRQQMLQRCEQLLDQDNDPAAAAVEVRGLMFVQRFAREVDARLEQLET